MERTEDGKERWGIVSSAETMTVEDPFILQIEKRLSEILGERVIVSRTVSIGGGCISHAQRLETNEGNVFLKYNDAHAFPGMFVAEANGLALLASTNSVQLPRLIDHGEYEGKSYLLLELIQTGRRGKKYWENFARSLAKLHRHSNAQFGLPETNYIGSLVQSNVQHASWIEFFLIERLSKQIHLAQSQGKVIGPWNPESFANRLESILPPEPPALLHGDLWNGNVLVHGSGEACLIDPAVYYGHREMDLAMTKLFGGFPEEFYEAYHVEYPLQPGFEERVDIHNLYPLLVHVNLFGGAYLEQANQILRRLERI